MKPEQEIAELKAQIKALQESLQILTHYMRHDLGWEAASTRYVDQKLARIDGNKDLSDEVRRDAVAHYTEINRLIRPHDPNL